MPTNKLRLVVGLGNPGKTYENTRHNAGFMVADKIARDFNIVFDKAKFDADFGRGPIETVDVILAKPMTFMNRSGPPLQKLAHYFRIPGEDMLVIHDDIDLAFGRIKIKEKGGHGGHKGLKSILNAIGEDEFMRLRIGVGRSETGNSVSDHVLGPFYDDELKRLDALLKRARDAVVTILTEGPTVAMNRFN